MSFSKTNRTELLGFNQTATDWDNYTSYRPPYPPSMIQLIMDYHRTHSGSFRLAHDIGAGSGVFAPALAKQFDHVHISDPNPRNVSIAQTWLSNQHKENQSNGRYTLGTCAAERVETMFADGSVDFSCLMMAAHWTDVDRMIQSVARTLASDGTLAIVHYHPVCRVLNNDIVDRSVQALFRVWGEEVVRYAKEQDGDDAPTIKRGMPQSNAGLDYVPLPKELFFQDNVRRITINAGGRGEKAFLVPGQESLLAASRTEVCHVKREFAHPDKEAEGWRQEVSPEFFRGFIKSMMQEGNLLKFDEAFKIVEAAIEETTTNGMVTVEWTVAILLASKR
jgi:SAM-dependent methyltransferase